MRTITSARTRDSAPGLTHECNSKKSMRSSFAVFAVLWQPLPQKLFLATLGSFIVVVKGEHESLKVFRRDISTSGCRLPTSGRSGLIIFRRPLRFSFQVKTKVKGMSQKDEEELYFAYGSNMNVERMKERKAFFTKREVSKLTGYKLEFSMRTAQTPGAGAANIIVTPQNTVHGILYTLKKGGLEKLDVFEGTSKGCYKRVKVKVETDDGNFVEATTYIVTANYYQNGLKPARWYLDHLLAGKDFLPPKYFSFLKSFETFD